MDLVADTLACRRAGRLVFAGLSFRVAGGEAAVVSGPNGAGKSSLLRLLAGLVRIEAGDASIGDASLRRDRETAQERVSYAGHLDAVKPALSTADNLRAAAAILGGEVARVPAALERFGLARLAETPALYLSAGQKRRLGLARLLVADRPVWLLDEPTVSLDRASAALVAEIAAEHVRGGGVVIAATHVDLGLPPGPSIDIAAAARAGASQAGPAVAEDPFLSGEWR